jgi:hypothetical protein
MSSLRVVTIIVPHGAATEASPELLDLPGERVVYVKSAKERIGDQCTHFEVLLERDDLAGPGPAGPAHGKEA